MTSEANTKWNHAKLRMGIASLIHAHDALVPGDKAAEQVGEALAHSVNFIEYNMREMEITDWNGDE